MLAFLVLPVARGRGRVVGHRQHDCLVSRFVLDGRRLLHDLERFLDDGFFNDFFGRRLGCFGVYRGLLLDGSLRFILLAAAGDQEQGQQQKTQRLHSDFLNHGLLQTLNIRRKCLDIFLAEALGNIAHHAGLAVRLACAAGIVVELLRRVGRMLSRDVGVPGGRVALA